MEIIKPSPKIINKTAFLLKRGGIVICPTDTIYGFLADASNKKAVTKIYTIKKRPKGKPLPVFVKNIAAAEKLAFIDKHQQSFLKKVWPGKVTVVLKRKPGAKIYGVAKGTIALRVPKYSFLNELLKKINRPLVQTSVNISHAKPLNTIADIIATFGKNRHIGFVIDAGDLKKVRPSKIVDATNSNIKILR